MQEIISIKRNLYTIWANKHLQGIQIHDLFFDISNSVVLINLVESLWKEPIGKEWNKNPQKFDEKKTNIQYVLDYLRYNRDIKISTKPYDVASDKSGKEALPLLDAIYIRYAIDTISFGGEKGKKALLKWCQQNAKESNVKIVDFKSSWKDGKALSAIFNKFQPCGMDFMQASERLGLKNFNPNASDEMINLIIASNLYSLFADTSSQELTISSTTNHQKKSSNSTSKDSMPTNNNNNTSSNTKKVKETFPKSNSKSKIKINIETPVFIQPNYKEGVISEKEVSKFKNKDYLPHVVNARYKHIIDSRSPVQVAHIPKGTKEIKFFKDNLRKVFERAGSRPIICVSILGSYQQGKSSSLGGITGSYGYATGNSVSDETKGVYIDGPYDIDYLYQRFNYTKLEERFFLKVDALKPVVFFFDIEGYGGQLHTDILKLVEEQDNLFANLCTPFMCLSSVFIFLSPAAPQVHEIETIVKTMRISTLTSIPKKMDDNTNGELKMIIAIKGFNVLPLKNEEENYSKAECETLINDSLMSEAKQKLKDGWEGTKSLEKVGIHPVFSPLIDRSNTPGYTITFGYFARDVISGIETAAQGHFMRGHKNCMDLFDFILENYSDGKFADKIKERISQEYQNTLGKVALRTCYEVRDEMINIINEEYSAFEKDLSKPRKTLESIKEKYLKMAQINMEKRIDVVGDSNEVHRYYQLLCYFISGIIDKKEIHIRELENDNQNLKTEESKNIAMGFYTKEFEDKKVEIIQELKANNFYNYNEKQTNDLVTRKSAIFKIKLENLKKMKNLKYFTDSDVNELSNNFTNEMKNAILIEFNNEKRLKKLEDEKAQYKINFEKIKNEFNQKEKARLEEEEKLRKEKQIMENKKLEAEIQKQKREAEIKTQDARARIIIKDKISIQLAYAFTRCENNEINELKEDLSEKQYFINTYQNKGNIVDQIIENIKNKILEKADVLIELAIEELKKKIGSLEDAIVRVYEEDKNVLMTAEMIDEFVESRTYLIKDDVVSCYITAKTLLANITFEVRRTKIEKYKWFGIETRKITTYPDGKEEKSVWKLIRKVKYHWYEKCGEFFRVDYTYCLKISQFEYQQLLKEIENA